jgi:hypothetical protein
MSIRFESQKQRTGSTQPMLFMEKHIYTITENVSASSLVVLENSTRSARNFAGATKVDTNTLICMTLGQQNSLFNWIEENKASALKKVDKSNMTDISDIPIPGCIVYKGKAWGGGTFTLGFRKFTGTVIEIIHLGSWDWAGSFEINTSKTLSSTEKNSFTA